MNEVDLESKELPEFLLSVFKEPKTEVLKDIGIKQLVFGLIVFAATSHIE